VSNRTDILNGRSRARGQNYCVRSSKSYAELQPEEREVRILKLYADMSKAPESSAPAEVCPVDAKTRAAWLKANPASSFPGASASAPASTASKGNGCDSEAIDQTPPSAPPGLFSRFFSSAPPPADAPAATKGLGTQRVISTIPRASPVDSSEGAKPANSEKESGVSESGNWIYPSEKMFFEAMKRKVGNV